MTELISTMAQVPLTNGCVVKWEAIDPASGAPVSDVVIQNATLYGYDSTDVSGAGPQEALPPLFVPIAQP